MGTQDRSYKLEELAKEVGVAPRTVRYYVQRGLLPAPVFRGKDTAYGGEHLLRLRAIRRLQDSFLPLDAIQAELEGKSSEEVRAIAEGRPTGRAPRRGGPPAPTAVPPRVSLPAPPPDESIGEGWTRFVIAEGLELHLADRADERTHALFSELRRAASKARHKGGSEP